MFALIFPVLCFVLGFVIAIYTRRKLLAIVLPSAMWSVMTIVYQLVSRPSIAIAVEELAFVSPYLVAAFLYALMFCALGAYTRWRWIGPAS